MRYKIYTKAIKLFDSHLVPKARFEVELNAIRYMHMDCPIWQARSMASMRREWATHNLLYSLGIKRNKTADCDLEFEQTWYNNLAYAIIGTIAFIFIK